MNSVMKTSQQWHEELQVLYPDFMVLYPSGWDRDNYQYSWHEELITNEEFEKRVARSIHRWLYVLQDIADEKFAKYRIAEEQENPIAKERAVRIAKEWGENIN